MARTLSLSVPDGTGGVARAKELLWSLSGATPGVEAGFAEGVVGLADAMAAGAVLFAVVVGAVGAGNMPGAALPAGPTRVYGAAGRLEYAAATLFGAHDGSEGLGT
jgi:hypothetical protein